jgi:hypothetical protein
LLAPRWLQRLLLLRQSLQLPKTVSARSIRVTTDTLRLAAKNSAAMRSLPRIVRIRWVQNSNSPTLQITRVVEVVVNDHGPFVNGREISVTRRAAWELGFVKQASQQSESKKFVELRESGEICNG